jgi:hypothetical protein
LLSVAVVKLTHDQANLGYLETSLTDQDLGHRPIFLGGPHVKGFQKLDLIDQPSLE